jgi:RecA-family ATPase
MANKPVDPLRQSIEQTYFLRIREYMDMIIEDPLVWLCPQTHPEDWDNVPETSAQLILYLQKHQEAIVTYLL